MVKITNKDKRCVGGIPMFVDGRKRLSHQEGLKRLRAESNLTTDELGKMIGSSGRTVEGYEQGRPIPATSLIVINAILGEDE